MLVVSIAHAVNPALYKLNYDPIKSFAPISIMATGPNVLAVNPTLPVKTLKEFVEHVKKNPGNVSYGTGGPGTPSHVMAVDFGNRVGAPLNVPNVATP